MVGVAENQFTHSHILLEDGTVSFKCASDTDQWPWLALHPLHPIVVQAINYWVSVETGTVRGTFDPTKWSALTQTEWSCGEGAGGHATHGVAATTRDDESPSYRLTFFDADGALVYHMSGKGVVFRTRNFEAWRETAKHDLTPELSVEDFEYASAERVGVATQDESFLSELSDDGTPTAEGLVRSDRAFIPNHPYHGGSGDHVNSNQLADVSRQFASLVLGHSSFIVTAGEMEFTRYVELGRPFRIALKEDGRSDHAVSMNVHQADRLCATTTFSLKLEP